MVNEIAQTPESPQETTQEKKQYTTPQVREFGTLRELTNFSETPNGGADYATYMYATLGY